MRHGAIILCGGKSTRMGAPKALLPIGPEIMLERLIRLVSEVVAPENIAIVAATGQKLPTLPKGLLLVHDARENRGPLEGLAAGLTALADRADAVYATGCDAPLLVPAFIEQMFTLLDNHDIAVPRDGKFYHPLAAVYRTSVLTHARQLLAADSLRTSDLLKKLNTREVPVCDLQSVDPDLSTLENLNSPEDYTNVLQRLGFTPPN